MVTPLNIDRSSAQGSRPTLSLYRSGPSLDEVRSGGFHVLQRGQSGNGVADLQRLLNEAGARPPLEVDGLFGPKTEAALRQYQSSRGLPRPDGRLDPATLAELDARAPAINGDDPPQDISGGRRPRTAPRIDQPPPEGSIRGGALQQGDEQARNQARSHRETPRTEQPPRTTGTTHVRPIQAAGPDGELAEIQRRTAQSAERELASGVREDPSLGRNRGARIDQYARDAGMPAGGEWCGYFTGFNYSEAARESGLRFRENIRFHSMQKARSFFEYRNYTNASRGENERLDSLRAQHEAQGSTRRWMTLSGSGGESHARSHNRPHEVYEPSNLPIRAGDTAVFSRGHLGVVTSYDQATGRLTTIEGNAGSSGDRVVQRTYDLNDPRDRARFEGFGRPARGDFTTP